MPIKILVRTLKTFFFRPTPIGTNKRGVSIWVEDAELGRRHKPNFCHECSILGPDGNIRWKYRVTFDEDGRRLSPLSEKTHNRLMATFGCSFTFGAAVNDQQSWPALLNIQLPKWLVHNCGIEGYSGYQCLLLMRRYLMQSRPDIIVYGYIRDHDPRNVRDFSRVPWFFGPMVALSSNGSLIHHSPKKWERKRRFDFFARLWESRSVRNQNLQRKATEAIISEMKAECDSKSIRFIVFELVGKPLLREYCSSHGIEHVFSSLDINQQDHSGAFRFSLMPNDGHLNPSGNLALANSLSSYLSGVTSKPFDGSRSEIPTQIYPLW